MLTAPVHRRLEHLPVRLGQGAAVQVGVRNDVSGFAFRQQRAIGLADDLVPEVEQRISYVFQPGAYQDAVVVPGRGPKPAARVYYGNEASIRDFHFFVSEAELAKQLYATNLKPDQIVRVVDHAHLVGLGVTHPQTGFEDMTW